MLGCYPTMGTVWWKRKRLRVGDCNFVLALLERHPVRRGKGRDYALAIVTKASNSSSNSSVSWKRKRLRVGDCNCGEHSTNLGGKREVRSFEVVTYRYD